MGVTESTERGFRLPSEVIEDVASDAELALDAEVWGAARTICESVEFHPDCPAADPKVIAASAVYIASLAHNDKRDMNTVGRAFGATGNAIMKRYPAVARAVDGLSERPLGPVDFSGLYDTPEPAGDGLGWRNYATLIASTFAMLFITDVFFLGWFVVDCPILYWIAGAC